MGFWAECAKILELSKVLPDLGITLVFPNMCAQ